MKSRITDCEAEPIFRAKVLGKYDVQYYRCPETGFIQTEEPYWLDEAYSEAITHLDIGLLARNISLRPMVAHAISRLRADDDHFIDYGGGYGIFVRLMRDWGFRFYRMDPHCKNLFAAGFDYGDATERGEVIGRPSLLTAFEVLEHLVDPLPELEKMLDLSDTVLASTTLQPNPSPKSIDDWWYFTPDTGQHVSLYTLTALENLASRLGANLISDNKRIHMITRRDDVKWRPQSRASSLISRLLLPLWQRDPGVRLTAFDFEQNKTQFLASQRSGQASR